jgi:membrane protein implicated in regulation of membrane protease activity
MDAWVVWLVAAVALGIGEMHQGAFYLGPFALGALLATALSLIGVGVGLSAVAFLVASIGVFAMLRPLVQRHRRLPPSLRTGASALIGRKAVVLERIANDEGVGIVKIDGEVWTARSFDDDAVIDVGEKVEVVEIRGATALVMQ